MDKDEIKDVKGKVEYINVFPNGVGDYRQDYGPVDFRQKRELDTTGLADVMFGKQMKDKEFALSKNNIFLNQASYGTVPKRVLDLQNEYIYEREDHPDLWFRYSAKLRMDEARQVVADFINAPVDNVMLLTNVTLAMNIFIKECPLKKGEAILDTTQTYGAVGYIVEDTINRIKPGVERIKLELSLPITSEDDIVNRYREALNKHPNIRVAIVDHITSPCSVVIPIKKIIQLCHSRDVLVFIDGAHSIGQIPLDMADIQADGFTTNLHKWAYSPKACALMYFNEKHRSWVRPLVTSWSHYGPVDMQFIGQGCMDHIPLICGQHGLEFIQALGGVKNIVSYTSDLADKASELICKRHGLKMLDLPPSCVAPNIRMIKLPQLPGYDVTSENLWNFQKHLFGPTNIFGLLVIVEGVWYFRISASIFNQLSDYEAAADALTPFLKKFAC